MLLGGAGDPADLVDERDAFASEPVRKRAENTWYRTRQSSTTSLGRGFQRRDLLTGSGMAPRTLRQIMPSTSRDGGI
jgi:hypothetical protein